MLKKIFCIVGLNSTTETTKGSITTTTSTSLTSATTEMQTTTLATGNI